MKKKAVSRATHHLSPRTRNILIGTAVVGAVGAALFMFSGSASAAVTPSPSPTPTPTPTPAPTGGSTPTPPGTISLSSTDSGSTIHANVGDTIIIALPPTTAGQAWIETDSNSAVLTSEGSDTSENLYRAASNGTNVATFVLTDATNTAVPGTAPLVFTITVP